MAEGSEQPAKKPTCFVIMPISDAVGYEPGHFGRVYEYLLKPAIIEAGYHPVRADDAVKTDYIVVGIIQKIIESEMVLCDISARNPNVMYELGIRHAFNKPVALVKDKVTEKTFDIQGLRYAEYDETLRVDTVMRDVTKIANSVVETSSATAKDANSIVHLAGIRAAELPDAQVISPDTQVILTALNELTHQVSGIKQKEIKRARTFISPSELAKGLYSPKSQIGKKVFKDDNYVGTVSGWFEAENHLIVATPDGGMYMFDLNGDAKDSIRIE